MYDSICFYMYTGYFLLIATSILLFWEAFLAFFSLGPAQIDEFWVFTAFWMGLSCFVRVDWLFTYSWLCSVLLWGVVTIPLLSHLYIGPSQELLILIRITFRILINSWVLLHYHSCLLAQSTLLSLPDCLLIGLYLFILYVRFGSGP